MLSLVHWDLDFTCKGDSFKTGDRTKNIANKKKIFILLAGKLPCKNLLGLLVFEIKVFNIGSIGPESGGHRFHF